MTNEKPLVARLTDLVAYDDANARKVMYEIANWMKDLGFTECAAALEKEADVYYYD